MLLKSLFLRIISFIVASAMLMFSGIGSHSEYDVKDPDNLKLNFTVISDSHIEGNNYERYKVFAQVCKDLNANKSGNDAVIFLGDNTMNGQMIENTIFHGTVSMLLKNQKVLPVVGNHDIGNGQGDYEKLQNRWYDYTGAFFGKSLDRPYYYEIIDGCYFIVLGMEAQKVYEMYISDEQFAWLEDTLSKAAESGKPAFVFSHYPADEVTDKDGEYTSRLIDMLAEYNKENDIFMFVGHTHMPMYLFWSFRDEGFPEIYLPRVTELGGEGDDEIIKNTGVGAEIEVYENEVTVRARDFYSGEWRYEEDEGKFCEMTYQLKNPVK